MVYLWWSLLKLRQLFFGESGLGIKPVLLHLLNKVRSHSDAPKKRLWWLQRLSFRFERENSFQAPFSVLKKECVNTSRFCVWCGPKFVVCVMEPGVI